MGQLRATQFRIDSVERTSFGALKVKGKLTKTGVFEYRRGDSVVRELRSEDEVFHADSIASLDGAPVTIDHPAEFVDSDNWKDLAVGHVSNVKVDAPYVEGTLHIHDSRAQHMVERGYLREISCGYFTECVDAESDDADTMQTSIRYNHAAMGPDGWGRLGSDVGLTLDSKGDQEITRFLHGAEALNTVGDNMSDKEVTEEVTDAQEALPLEDHRPLFDRLAERLDSLEAKLESVVAPKVEEKPYSEEVKLDSADEIKAKISEQVERALGLELRARAAYETVWPSRKCDSAKAVGQTLCEELLGMDSEHELGLEELVVRSEIAAATAKRERLSLQEKEDSARRAALLGVPHIEPGVSPLERHILGK